MTLRLWSGSTQQATDQSNPQKLNSKQNSSETTIESLQTDLQQHSDTSVPEEQNIDKLLKTAQVQNEILQKKHKLTSLLTKNKALKEISQMRQLPQAGAALMISHIN